MYLNPAAWFGLAPRGRRFGGDPHGPSSAVSALGQHDAPSRSTSTSGAHAVVRSLRANDLEYMPPCRLSHSALHCLLSLSFRVFLYMLLYSAFASALVPLDPELTKMQWYGVS